MNIALRWCRRSPPSWPSWTSALTIAKGAGEGSRIPDECLRRAGDARRGDADEIFGADVVLAVNAPDAEQIGQMKKGAVLISFVQAPQQSGGRRCPVKNRVTCFAMELMPRITRAQSMDALVVAGRVPPATRRR